LQAKFLINHENGSAKPSKETRTLTQPITHVGYFRRCFPLAVIVAIFALSGCGSEPEREAVYPVTGEVFFKGAPADGAVVWLHPVESIGADASNPASKPPLCAKVQSDGSFKISTYGVNDGAPVGRYRVSVMWTNGQGSDGSEKHLLPARLMDPRKSGLPIVEIKAGPNVLPAFKLTP
jgi:hypothetical protein